MTATGAEATELASPLAFVLAGGSTRGAVQVGMLRALLEAGIRPDLVVGTSVGALNGAVYGGDLSLAGVAALGELWRTAPRAQIFPFSPLSMAMRAVAHRNYLMANDGLRRWIEAHTTFDRLEDSPVALHVVATDLASGTAVVLSEGLAVPALLASSAIPGVFPPVEVAGRLLCDGALSADAPIAQAAALGARTIVVLPTAPGPDGAAVDERPDVRGERLSNRARGLRVLDQVFGRKSPDRDAEVLPPGIVVHRLPAPSVHEVVPFSFRGSARLIEQAHTVAVRWLAASGLGDADADADGTER